MNIRIIRRVIADGGCTVQFAASVGTAWASWNAGDRVPEVGGEYDVEISTTSPRGIQVGGEAEMGRIDGDEQGPVRLGGRVVNVWEEDGRAGAAINLDCELVLIELAP